MTTIQTTLAGANFRPAEAKAVLKESLSVGDAVFLEPDPNNEYDDHAVRVIAQGEFIGFVAKADNPVVFDHLEDGGEYAAEVIAFESTLKPIIEIDLIDADD